MLRKAVHIIFAFLLLISTMGFSVSKHYCGTRLVDVSINAMADTCCGDMGTSKCCHNETHHFQLTENFVGSTPSTIVEIAIVHVLFPIVFSTLLLEVNQISLSQIVFYDSPPPPDIHIHLALLQSYLI